MFIILINLSILHVYKQGFHYKLCFFEDILIYSGLFTGLHAAFHPLKFARRTAKRQIGHPQM